MSIHQELAVWRCHIQVAKFWGDWTPDSTPYDILDIDGNMLVYGGVSALWEMATADTPAIARFTSANSAIGVGDSATASTAAMTDLQGTNKLRKLVNGGYPEHTDGTGVANNTVRFRSTFDTTEANFAWNEAGVFNSTTVSGSRMLNRRVQSMGTKTSTSSWQITFDISITSVGP